MLLNISRLEKRIKRTVRPTLKLWITRPLKVYNRTYNKQKIIIKRQRRLLNGVNKGRFIKPTLLKYIVFFSNNFIFFFDNFLNYRWHFFMCILEQHYLKCGYMYRCENIKLIRSHEYQYKFFKKFIFRSFGHYKMVDLLPQSLVNGWQKHL